MSDNYRSLPHASPYQKAPIGRVVMPPAPQGLMSGMSQALGRGTFTARVTGVSGAFPVGNRVATFTFNRPVSLLSITLASSIVNASATTPACLFVAKDVGATYTVLDSTEVEVEHVVEVGLSHSLRSGTSYIDDMAPQFGSNEKLAIYCSSSDAANFLTGIVTVRYLLV